MCEEMSVITFSFGARRIRTTKYHHFYATFSNDGTTKIWDGSKVDGKTLVTKSRVTFNQGIYVAICV